MNVFILGLSRSGTTTLLNAFKTMYNGTLYGEPFNRELDRPEMNTPYYKNRRHCKLSLDLGDKWALKAISNHITVQDAKLISQKADLTIILGRKDHQKRLESFSYAFKTSNFSWHEGYSVEDQEIPQYIRDVAANQETMLSFFSEILEVPITYYEDLYFNQEFKENFSKQFGDLAEKFVSLLDPSNKYRKERGII